VGEAMSWKCPECGLDENPDDESKCLSCGYVKVPDCVVLVSSSTGESFSMRIDTVVGKYVLKTIVGDDYKFASDKQFRIVKDSLAGEWRVFHVAEAVNQTFVDGTELSSGGTALREGMVVSVGVDKVKLKVLFG